MSKTLARRAVVRALRGVGTVWLVALATWACLEAAPGQPAEAAARAAGILPAQPLAVNSAARDEMVRVAASRFAIEDTWPQRLGVFVVRLATLDLGRSWRSGTSVAVRVRQAAATTLVLLGFSLLVATLFGVTGALLSAARPGGIRDQGLSAVFALMLSLPPAWAAVILLRFFAAGEPFSWLPPGGEESVLSYVLPVVCMAYVSAAFVARHGRAALVAAHAKPFVVAARARGASPRRTLMVHALSVASAPIVALFSSLVPYLLGVSLVVERAFDLPGLGALMLDAASGQDAPVVIGVTIVVGVLVVTGSALADALVALIDPRAPAPEKK